MTQTVESSARPDVLAMIKGCFPASAPLLIRLGLGGVGLLGSSMQLLLVLRLGDAHLVSSVLGASPEVVVASSALTFVLSLALITGFATRLFAAFGMIKLVASSLDFTALSQAYAADMVRHGGEALGYLFRHFTLWTVSFLAAYAALLLLGAGRWSIDARIGAWASARRAARQTSSPAA